MARNSFKRKELQPTWDELAQIEKYVIQHPPKGYMKGLPAIRVLLFAVPILAMLLAFILLFVGGFEVHNGVAMNVTIAGQYNSLNSSVVGQGSLFSQIAGISTQVNSTRASFQNGGFDIFGAFRLMFALLVFMINFYFNLASFIAIPLIAFGIPATFALAMADILLIAIPILIIASAYFLKDV